MSRIGATIPWLISCMAHVMMAFDNTDSNISSSDDPLHWMEESDLVEYCRFGLQNRQELSSTVLILR